jgi:hypothetical protein
MKIHSGNLSAGDPCNQLTSRQNIGRGRFDRSAGSRGAVTKNTSGAENISIPIPSGSIASPEPVLETLNLSQAVLDGLAAVVGLLFLVALAGSIPLAVALMFVAAF